MPVAEELSQDGQPDEQGDVSRVYLEINTQGYDQGNGSVDDQPPFEGKLFKPMPPHTKKKVDDQRQ
ncbi:MAG: hypothetical protein AB7D40_10640 [Bacteroidales bacterium]